MPLNHASLEPKNFHRFHLSRSFNIKQQHAHFEQLHSDLATINGRDFLIIADQYSGSPDVIPFPNKNTTALRVVDAVREFFIRGPGTPVKFWSDNGPQFNAVEFKDFARDWGISVGNSAPHYPQSNGFAEAAISSMKNSSPVLGEKAPSTLINLQNLFFFLGTLLAQVPPLQHKWYSTGRYAMLYQLIADHLHPNGSRKLTYWKKRQEEQKNSRSSITTVQLTHFSHSK